MVTYWSTYIEMIHRVIGIGSSLICLLLGLRLLFVRLHEYGNRKNHFRCLPYATTCKSLGFAYIITGVLSWVMLYTFDIRLQEPADFFPLTKLIISFSQIILFTVAALSLFQSHLLNPTMATANLVPLALLLFLYVLFSGRESILLSIRIVLYIYYFLLLMVYTSVFIMKRRKDSSDRNSVQNKLLNTFNAKDVSILYFCAIAIGFWSLTSYFFTTLFQEIIFKVVYTTYYIVVAWYILRKHPHPSPRQNKLEISWFDLHSLCNATNNFIRHMLYKKIRTVNRYISDRWFLLIYYLPRFLTLFLHSEGELSMASLNTREKLDRLSKLHFYAMT